MDTPKNAVEAIQNPVIPALEREGITPELLAKKLKEELEATEVKVFRGYAVEGTGEDKKVKSGELIYSEELIAWKIRQVARQDAHKLLGHYPKQEIDLTVAGVIGLKEALDSAETQEPFKPGKDG